MLVVKNSVIHDNIFEIKNMQAFRCHSREQVANFPQKSTNKLKYYSYAQAYLVCGWARNIVLMQNKIKVLILCLVKKQVDRLQLNKKYNIICNIWLKAYNIKLMLKTNNQVLLQRTKINLLSRNFSFRRLYHMFIDSTNSLMKKMHLIIKRKKYVYWKKFAKFERVGIF